MIPQTVLERGEQLSIFVVESRVMRAATRAVELGAENEQHEPLDYWRATVQAWIEVYGHEQVRASIASLGSSAPAEMRDALRQSA